MEDLDRHIRIMQQRMEEENDAENAVKLSEEVRQLRRERRREERAKMEMILPEKRKNSLRDYAIAVLVSAATTLVILWLTSVI